MYKTILCAIEASQEGKEVLAKASAIAKLYGSKLLVINVLPFTFLPKDYQKTLKEDNFPKIEKITSSFDIAKKNCFVKVGKPYEHICNLAEKKNVDLIILGTHSKRGIRSVMGSTANGVSSYATCDVTLIRMK